MFEGGARGNPGIRESEGDPDFTSGVVCNAKRDVCVVAHEKSPCQERRMCRGPILQQHRIKACPDYSDSLGLWRR